MCYGHVITLVDELRSITSLCREAATEIAVTLSGEFNPLARYKKQPLSQRVEIR